MGDGGAVFCASGRHLGRQYEATSYTFLDELHPDLSILTAPSEYQPLHTLFPQAETGKCHIYFSSILNGY